MASDAITITLPTDLPPDSLETILDALPNAAGVAVVGAGAQPVNSDAAAIDAAIDAAVSELPNFGQALSDWSARVIEATGGVTPLTVLAITLAIFAAVYAVEWSIIRWMSARREAPPPPDSYFGLLSNTLMQAIFYALRLVFFAVLSMVLVRLLFSNAVEEAREIFNLALAGTLKARLIYMIALLIARPEGPAYRPSGFSNKAARRFIKAVFVLIIATAPVPFIGDTIMVLADAGVSGIIPATAIKLLVAVMLVWFFFYIRKDIGDLILRAMTPNGREPSGIARFTARFWHWIYVVFVIVNTVMNLRSQLITGGESAKTNAMLILTITPFLLSAVVEWRREAESRHSSAYVIAALALAQGGLVVGAAVMLLRDWGLPAIVEPGATGLALIVPGLVRAGAILAVGYAIWIAVSSVIGLKLGGGGTKGDDGDIPDEGGAGGGRMETIAPILRGFALVLVGVVTLMMALSSLGIDTAPLLAGAGVLGLAIGFGAQKLVSDIISGVFYMYEDSFRIGEYIVTDEGKGRVEKISLRSVRLRHHRGPVYTIAYSSMGTIQNHSRDWVKIKFTFEVSSDTDLEMVRKLVKKVGVQLLADPEFEGMFLEPLKSQGAIGIQGRSYIIGCKYTTKPGMQFTIRRKVFSEMQKALAEKGIELAAPRIAFDTGAGGNPAQAMMQAASGGAAPA